MKRTTHRLTILAGAILLAGLLAACGGEEGSDAAAESAPIAGCTKEETEELFVAELYGCPDGTYVYTFATEDARENWLKVAKEFGAAPTAEGRLWLRVTEL